MRFGRAQAAKLQRHMRGETEGTSSFALTHPARSSYCLHRKRASSGQLKRAMVRTARKAISYQFQMAILATDRYVNEPSYASLY